MPGGQRASPANLTSAKGITFRIRGNAEGLGIMGFSEAGGQQPSLAKIGIGDERREVTVVLDDLMRFDKTGTTMLMIGAFARGPYMIEIEDIRLSMARRGPIADRTKLHAVSRRASKVPELARSADEDDAEFFAILIYKDHKQSRGLLKALIAKLGLSKASID